MNQSVSGIGRTNGPTVENGLASIPLHPGDKISFYPPRSSWTRQLTLLTNHGQREGQQLIWSKTRVFFGSLLPSFKVPYK